MLSKTISSVQITPGSNPSWHASRKHAVQFIGAVITVPLMWVLAATSCEATTPDESSPRPNVLVILTDDQGWGDLSVNGNRNLQTPNIDGLAAAGAQFDRFYVCPVCSPTRAEFLTGRYHPRGGVYSTSAGGERLNADERTIAESFQAAGYRTAAFGKWHNGMQFPYHPNARGFDEFYGFCSGHWGSYWDAMLDHNGEIVQGKGFIIDDLTSHAIDFIRQDRDEPFFVYVPYNTPHSPMQVPDRWWNKFRDADLQMHNRDPKREDLNHIRAALAMCENIDWNVGRLLETLGETGQADNTIVVYFCDNGPNGYRWNGDMKGRKGSTDEGGVRSPCLIRWPAKIEAGRVVKRIGAAIDLHPTLAGMAGIKTVNDAPFDGRDISSLLTGNETDSPDNRILISHWRNKVSARTGSLRMDSSGQVFDLETDPGQRVNVTKQHPDAAQRLKAAIDDYRATVMPGYGKDDRPFVIAHPDAPLTQLPARDGIAHGNIQRSNRFPNSSYFTKWTSTNDSITWDVEVLTAGAYEVELYYTSPPEAVGSMIQLSFADARLTGTLRKAHPGQIVGRKEDRVPRAESYEQNWTNMTLGTIELPAGTGQLKLSATEISGDSVMDFRLMTLRRIAR